MKKRLPYSFVIDELEPIQPVIKTMFGCYSVYIGDKIVLFLSDRERPPKGVWVATTAESYPSLAQEFSSTRSVERPRIGKSPWLLLPAAAVDFEEQALHACELILKRDPRIGRAPARALKKAKKAVKAEKKK